MTFLVSGIWHGANWTFIVWGIIHGFAQIIEKAFKLPKSEANLLIKTVRTIITFVIITLAWLVFRMPTLNAGFEIIGKLFINHELTLATCPISSKIYIIIALIIVLIKDSVDEYFNKGGVTIIEWAEIIQNKLPKERLEITFNINCYGDFEMRIETERLIITEMTMDMAMDS